jgi:hypothetical protein
MKTVLGGVNFSGCESCWISLSLSLEVVFLKLVVILPGLRFNMSAFLNSVSYVGSLKHGAGGCQGRKGPIPRGGVPQAQFGTWLRASPMARRFGLLENILNIFNSDLIIFSLHTILYSLYIPINRDDLYCKSFKQ